MKTPLRPVITACLLAGVTLLLYGFRLSAPPIGAEERLLVQQAQTGRGPVFFQATDDRWLMPVPVYATRLAATIVTPDLAGRLAAVIVSAFDVALLFLCARYLFNSELAALIAAALLIVMPAHLTFGRQGIEAMFPLPFVSLSLLALLRYLKTDSPRAISIAGFALGGGIYTHRSAPLTMTFLLALFIAALIVNRRKWASVGLLAGSFLLMLIPAAVWFALHPETYPDTFGRWAIFLAHVRNPMDGVRAFLNWNTLGNRASLYWGFLDPAWLFFGGPLLLPMLPFLLIGIAGWRRVLSPAAMLLAAGGAIVTPLGSSSFGEPHYIADALAFLPFTALLTTAGVVYCWKRLASVPTGS